MKKIIVSLLLCYCTLSMYAQDTCVGSNTYYPLKISMRMGYFTPPDDSPDSLACYSAAFGSNTKAKGYSSLAIGNHASTRGDYSFAGGSYSIASGLNSIATGFGTLASGAHSASFGYQSIASNNYAFATGYYTTASAPGSFAAGRSTNASNDYSFAAGSWTTASGYSANAMGSLCNAAGYSSTALGYAAFTSADMSLSLGMFTKAKSYAGMVTGLYNDSSNAPSSGSINANNRIFQIGNGTADNARSNAMTVLQNGNVGVGVLNPTTKLHIRGEVGFWSSNKTWTVGYDSINHYFFIDEYGFGKKLFIKDGGNVGIGVTAPVHKLEVSGNIKSTNDIYANNNIQVDMGNINVGSLENALRFGSLTSGEGIASRRTGNGNGFGLDLYTNNINRLAITNAGNVGIGMDNPGQKLDVSGSARLSGSMLVQTNKGIIRSNDATQQKKLVTTVSLNYTFQAGETRTFTVTWPESFGATPDAFVGNIVSGAGGWAEVVMSLSNVTSTGATLYVYNPKTSTVVPNFTVKLIAIGAQ